jgi:hypothetical protein
LLEIFTWSVITSFISVDSAAAPYAGRRAPGTVNSMLSTGRSCPPG